MSQVLCTKALGEIAFNEVLFYNYTYINHFSYVIVNYEAGTMKDSCSGVQMKGTFWVVLVNMIVA